MYEIIPNFNVVANNSKFDHFTRHRLKVLCLLSLCYIVVMLLYVRPYPLMSRLTASSLQQRPQLPDLDFYVDFDNFTDEKLFTSSATQLQWISNKTTKSKVILQWTRYFSHQMFFEETYDESELLGGCSVKNCRFTFKESEFDVADVVLFHGPDLVNLAVYPEHRGLRRRPEQLYVYVNKESPAMYPFIPDQQIPLNFFNLTMTYRRDSDIPKNYGEIQSFPARADEPNETSYFKLKQPNKLAVWYVSNCGRSKLSNRMPYAKKLQNILGANRVDIFGHCTNMWDECPPDGPSDCMSDLSKYFFYLSFENSICDDYVTEKLYRAFANRLVPVVNNRRVNYDLHAPRGSYIHTRDFKSVVQLAAHLERVAQNETLYNQYMAWRQDEQSWLSLPIFTNPYDVTPAVGLLDGPCRLCAILNDPQAMQKMLSKDTEKGRPKVIEDIVQWWSDGHCDSYGDVRNLYSARWPADEFALSFQMKFTLIVLGLVVLFGVPVTCWLIYRKRLASKDHKPAGNEIGVVRSGSVYVAQCLLFKHYLRI